MVGEYDRQKVHHLSVAVGGSYTEMAVDRKRRDHRGAILAERVSLNRPRYEKVCLRQGKNPVSKYKGTSTITELMGMLNTMRTGQMVELNMTYRTLLLAATKEVDATVLTKRKDEVDMYVVKLAPYYVGVEQKKILMKWYEEMELQDYARRVMGKVRSDMQAFPYLLGELEDIGLGGLIPEGYPRDVGKIRELLASVDRKRMDAAEEYRKSLGVEKAAEVDAGYMLERVEALSGRDRDIAGFL
jgi:hypothetical protein